MRDMAADTIAIDINTASGGGLSASQTMTVDLIASSIAGDWKRPVYFATTIPESLYMGFSPYMLCTGMAYQISPVKINNDGRDKFCNTDKMFDIVTKKFKWGGLDKAKAGALYLDETVTRMVTTTRSSILSLADALCTEGQNAIDNGDNTLAADRFAKAEQVLDLMCEKLPASVCPYQAGLSLYISQDYAKIGRDGNRATATQKATKLIEREIMRYAQYAIYYQQLHEQDLADRMSTSDMMVIQQLIPTLFDIYRDVNPKGVNKLIDKFQHVKVAGKSLDPAFVKQLTMSYDEIQQQQQAQARAQAEAAAAAAAAPQEEYAPDQEQDYSMAPVFGE